MYLNKYSNCQKQTQGKAFQSSENKDSGRLSLAESGDAHPQCPPRVIALDLGLRVSFPMEPEAAVDGLCGESPRDGSGRL